MSPGLWLSLWVSPPRTVRLMIRFVSWNMGQADVWSELDGLGADVALLQEAAAPASSLTVEVHPDVAAGWATAGWQKRRWRTAIARLSDTVVLNVRPTFTIDKASSDAHWSVSREGTLTAADVIRDGEVVITAVSVYAAWERTAKKTLYADASAHRLLSDLSALMGSPGHRLIVAGDWNILYGYGEHGDTYFKARYATVFERAEALGLCMVGPQFPSGRQANPWPAELPVDSLCVPTFHHSRQTPSTATRQLDFAFASGALADRVSVRALKSESEWGPSDHCRVLVDVDI